MRPLKLYPKKNSSGYGNLLKVLNEEGSLLGDDVDREGKHYIIVDLDCSPSIKKFIKQFPNKVFIREGKEQGK